MAQIFDQVLGPMEIALNRYLAGNAEILEKLAQQKGALSIEFRDLAWSFSMLPTAHGFQIMPGQFETRASLSTSLIGMARLLAGEDPRQMGGAAHLEGDLEFAVFIFSALRQAEFDLGGELSQLMGPVLGQKIGQGLREVFGISRQAVSGFLGESGRVLRDDNKDLVAATEAEDWMSGVDDSAAAVDRLEARLARLEQARRVDSDED